MRRMCRVVAVFLVALAAACAGQPQATVVPIESFDFGFNAPQSIETGLVKLEFSNTGQQSHHLIMAWGELIRRPGEERR